MSVCERERGDGEEQEVWSLWLSDPLPAPWPAWHLQAISSNRVALELQAQSMQRLIPNRRLRVEPGREPPRYRAKL